MPASHCCPRFEASTLARGKLLFLLIAFNVGRHDHRFNLWQADAPVLHQPRNCRRA